MHKYTRNKGILGAFIGGNAVFVFFFFAVKGDYKMLLLTNKMWKTCHNIAY